MLRGKKIKVLFTVALVVLFTSIISFGYYQPKYNSSINTGITINPTAELNSQRANEGETEPLDKPAYFNIFKLIFGFLPGNSNQQ